MQGERGEARHAAAGIESIDYYLDASLFSHPLGMLLERFDPVLPFVPSPLVGRIAGDGAREGIRAPSGGRPRSGMGGAGHERAAGDGDWLPDAARRRQLQRLAT